MSEKGFFRQSSFVADRNAPAEVQGDCWSTCVAILLGEDEAYRDELHRYVSVSDGYWWNVTLGFVLLKSGGRYTLTDVEADATGETMILSGQSPRGDWLHTIISTLEGDMVWDPHPDETGLVSREEPPILERVYLRDLS